MKLSSCIGNQFDIETLAIIAETSPTEAALSLHDAIAQGLILPLNDYYKLVELDVIKGEYSLITKQVEYKFVHDRIQQAAYSLIYEADKPAKHLQIGRLLQKSIPTSEQKESIFDIVNQLNKAIEIIKNQSEKNELAQLNLIAGKKAKASAAYQSAFNYQQVSINLLAENSWDKHYKLTLEIYDLAAETACFCGCFEQMEQLTAQIKQQVKTKLDSVKAYQVEIQALISRNQLLLAVNTGLKVLNLLGIRISENPNNLNVWLQLVKTKLTLLDRKNNYSDISRTMTDVHKIAAMNIMTLLASHIYHLGSNLHPFTVLKQVNISAKYGNHPSSIFGYAAYGTVLCGLLNNIDAGYQFGQLAIKLLSRLNSKEIATPVIVVVQVAIIFWKEHLKYTLNPLLDGYSNGHINGNNYYASHCLFFYCKHSYFLGKELSSLEKTVENYSKQMIRLNQKATVNHLNIFKQLILNLINGFSNLHHLSEMTAEENKLLTSDREKQDKTVIFYLYFNKSMLCFLFEKSFLAFDNISLANSYSKASTGMFSSAAFNFYQSLIQINTYLDSDSFNKNKILKQIRYNQKRMKKWAEHAPMNFLHKYYLVEAEKCRVSGKSFQAADLYIRAINLARENEYLNEEALAYELAAKFYLARDHILVASTYMKQARYCYLKWGAKAKVKHLDDNYPELLATVVTESDQEKSITTSSSSNQETLDLNTLIKTSQAIAQINDFSQLLETLIKFVLENAGAQKGFIILVQADNLIIQGSGTAEEITTLQALPVDNSRNLSQTVINYIYRTQENLVLDNACGEGLFINDEYISSNKIKSVLCLPILNQGKLIGILYLENNLAENNFTSERLEVLKLISTQVAISIENALLRQQEQEQVFEYQVGGCLTIDSPTYVIRQADTDLYQNLKQGNYCYILNSRHMGKSSLRVRIMNRLQTEGIICAALDLTIIGSQQTTIEQWYAGVIYRLVNNLKLSKRFDFRNWWRSLDLLSPVQRFSEFIEQILLREIRGKIIIFIDEIDSTLSLKFKLDDFFAVIRACYNNRNDNPEYQRLNFVLLGVATSTSLIQDKHRTPFNIGHAIALQGFKLHEINPLISGFSSKYQNSQVLIEQVLVWTGGQPFLTQKICSLIADAQIDPAAGEETEWIDSLIQTNIIDNWESKDDPQHFRTIRDRILNSSEPVNLLQLYQKILTQTKVIVNDSNEHKKLLLSGLVKQEANKFQVYNRIYQSVFDLAWCDRILDSMLDTV